MFRDFGLRQAFQGWSVLKWLKIDQDDLHVIFSALNVDFSSVKFRPPTFNEACARGCQKGVPPKNSYFSDIAILACPAWKWLQIRTDMLLIITSTGNLFLVVLTSMTLNDPGLQNRRFWWFLFEIFGCIKVICDEMDGFRSRQLANRNCYRLSRVSWALTQISCILSNAMHCIGQTITWPQNV